MKPSIRIKEIYKTYPEPHSNVGVTDNAIAAIVKYLDEEYEKNKPCEHKIRVPMNEKVCRICGEHLPS